MSIEPQYILADDIDRIQNWQLHVNAYISSSILPEYFNRSFSRLLPSLPENNRDSTHWRDYLPTTR